MIHCFFSASWFHPVTVDFAVTGFTSLLHPKKKKNWGCASIMLCSSIGNYTVCRLMNETAGLHQSRGTKAVLLRWAVPSIYGSCLLVCFIGSNHDLDMLEDYFCIRICSITTMASGYFSWPYLQKCTRHLFFSTWTDKPFCFSCACLSIPGSCTFPCWSTDSHWRP